MTWIGCILLVGDVAAASAVTGYFRIETVADDEIIGGIGGPLSIDAGRKKDYIGE